MKKILLFFTSIFIALMFVSNIKINAKTNYQYNVLFDYSTTYIVNAQSKIISSGYAQVRLLDRQAVKGLRVTG